MKKQSQKTIKRNIENLLSEVRKNILLKNYTTFKIGGPAKYFFTARNKNDLVRAVIAARELEIPFFILGEGSNMLVSDKGFKGLIIQIKNQKYRISKNKVYTDSGTLISVLVKESIKKGLAGLEWAGGLPGTLGGAVRGNAGAFGGEIKDSVVEVEFLDNENKIQKISNKKCNFSYRSSIFKQKNFIILSAVMQLKKGDKKSLWNTASDYIKYRRDRHPLEYPNAGSIFKNYDFKKASRKVKKLFVDVVKTDPFPIIPTALIILEAGLSGKKIGRAQISTKHSNYMVNLGGATARDVKKLIKFAKKTVEKKFKLKLEEEIKLL